MIELKLENIIKIIPMEDSQRKYLLENLTKFDPATKLEVEEVLWEAFHKVREALIEKNYNALLKDVEEGKIKLTEDLMQQAKLRVWQDFEEMMAGKIKDVEQIQDIREKLYGLIKSQKNQTAN